ncbi:hypothetical protein [Streptomyces chattanoogensis]|uniref:hypothetical protein n=1 Tax=Streptomyces chattanoogensis TaxID=66876 RepID=UPI0012FEA2B8|nr:hypothetical protein [Streptomyces chattanoogensis]
MWGIIGAIVGVLVIGRVASAAISAGGGGGGAGKPSAGPKYKITVPKSLVGGEYTLAENISQQADSQVPHDGANSHGVRTVGGQYTAGTKTLVMIGMYGTIDDADTSVDHMIEGMTNAPGAEVGVPEKKFTPSGGGKPLTCGVDMKNQAGQKVTFPFCVWGTSSTTANVALVDAADPAKDPKSIDLQALADTASKIRDEVQVPVSG